MGGENYRSKDPFDREQSIQNFLANPTEDEAARWASMSPDEITAEINAYLDRVARSVRDAQDIVAAVDDLAAALDPARNRAGR